MPYYGAGDYSRGDYYRGGDYYRAGGLFGSIGKLLGGVAKTVIGATPVGAVANALVPSFVAPTVRPKPTGLQIVPEPGLTGFVHRIAPGGSTGYMIGGRRRRMNVTNVRALRRAGRRVRGFLKIARRLGALPVSGGKGKKLFKTRRKSR